MGMDANGLRTGPIPVPPPTDGLPGGAPPDARLAILLAVENPAARLNVGLLLLKGLGAKYLVTEVERPADALRICRDEPPDCVVIDDDLSGGGATAFLSGLSTPAGIPSCPVVVLIGDRRGVEAPLLQAGAHECIAKTRLTAEVLDRAVENSTVRSRIAAKRAAADAEARQLAEDHMRLREAQLGLALQAANSISFEWDIVNDRVRRTHSAETALPETREAAERFEDVVAKVHPADRASFRANVQSAIAGGTAFYSSEYRVLRPDGAIVWLSERGRVLCDASRRPLRLIGVAHDITGRKEIEESLRRSEHRLHLAMDAAGTGLWEWDLATQAVTWSAECYVIHGIRPGRFDGTAEGFDRQVHPDDRERVWATVRRAVEARTKYECEFRIVRPDGEVRWVSNVGRAVYDGGGPPTKMVGTIIDITTRKLSDEKIRQDEAKYRATFDNAAVGIAHVGLDGRWLEFNKVVCAITGYSAAELSQKTFADITHPDDVAKDWAEAHRLLAGEINEYSLEKRYLRPGGAIVWVCLTVSLLRAPDGAAKNFISIIEDITARKAIEDQLVQTRERLAQQFAELESIYRSVPLGLAVLDRELRFLRVNDRLAELNGATVSAHIDRALDCVTPALAAQARNAFETVLSSGAILRMETRGETGVSSGAERIRDERWYPIRDTEGRVSAVGLVVDDITDRRRLELELRSSEALFRALADNLPHLAWMADHEGNVFWQNRRWREFTDAPLPHKGADWESACHPDHIGRVNRTYREALQAETTWEETFPLRGKDGAFRWFLARAFPVRDHHGTIMRWYGTHTDITVARETHEALREAQAQIRLYATDLEARVAARTRELQDTVEELEAFSYSIAHDMRAPLRSMVGFADILQQDHAAQLDAAGRSHLQRIAKAGHRLDLLIMDALNYGRVLRAEYSLEPVNVRQLIADLLESYPNLMSARAHIDVAADLPVVKGNTAALSQVFSNLLGNAVKFVAPGAAPRVRVFARRPALPSDNGSSDRMVRIYVADEGIGIDPAFHPRLFKMFQRFPSASGYEGTGMGLAIARKAVERINGRIGIDPEPGGCRFWIELPLWHPSDGAVESSP